MEKNKIYLGDCLEVLRGFQDESIDMCVTSPPYYGLRDYGTGTWVGGDPNCSHYRDSKKSEPTATGYRRMQELGEDVGDAIYKSVCPKCGAVRIDKQIGLEDIPEDYIERLVILFREVRRVLKKDGTLWVNIGDSYWGGGWRGTLLSEHSGDIQKGSLGTVDAVNIPRLVGNRGVYKDKDLIGIPWMLAFALRADGWYLRQDIIWHKPNPMPESVKDRCTKSHEYVFLLSKSKKYYFDYKAIQEVAKIQIDPRVGSRVEYDGKRKGMAGTGNRAFVSLKTKPRLGGVKYDDNDSPLSENVVVRNKRDVWTVTVKPTKEAHFATYPEKLITPCILAGCREEGVVLDPFIGSGTTGIVARNLNRNYIGIELNPKYKDMAERRIFNMSENLFNQV